jgi:hypothetical protein
MLSREDFVFTIGYDGPAAVGDKQAKRKYGKLSTRELAAKGLFRPAYSSAVYSGNQEDLKFVAAAFKRLGDADPSNADPSTADLSKADLSALDRLFGVYVVDAKRAVYI